MTRKQEMQVCLSRIRRRYTLDGLLEDIYSILAYMGFGLGILFSLLISLDFSGVIDVPHPKIAASFAIFMVLVTCTVYSLWNFVFYRKSLSEIVQKLDDDSNMQEELIYAASVVDKEDDIVLQYLAEKALHNKESWRGTIQTHILQNMAKIMVILLCLFVALWFAQSSSPEPFFSRRTPAVNNNAEKVVTQQQKQQQQKQKEKQKQQQQKQQEKQQQKQDEKGKGDAPKEKGEKKQPQPTPEESDKPKKEKPQENKNQDKNVPAPGNNKGKENKGGNKDKKLPDVKPEIENVSPLFGDGKNIDSYANTGGKETNKKDSTQLEAYYQNLEQLPIFFRKQFIPVEDQLAIKRYFNMIHPQQGN